MHCVKDSSTIDSGDPRLRPLLSSLSQMMEDSCFISGLCAFIVALQSEWNPQKPLKFQKIFQGTGGNCMGQLMDREGVDHEKKHDLESIMHNICTVLGPGFHVDYTWLEFAEYVHEFFAVKGGGMEKISYWVFNNDSFWMFAKFRPMFCAHLVKEMASGPDRMATSDFSRAAQALLSALDSTKACRSLAAHDMTLRTSSAWVDFYTSMLKAAEIETTGKQQPVASLAFLQSYFLSEPLNLCMHTNRR